MPPSKCQRDREPALPSLLEPVAFRFAWAIRSAKKERKVDSQRRNKAAHTPEEFARTEPVFSFLTTVRISAPQVPLAGSAQGGGGGGARTWKGCAGKLGEHYQG
jgi:hypothetical protein